MDIAINSLVAIFFFIVPVIVFTKFYYRKAFSKQFSVGSFFYSVVVYLIPGILLQILFGFLYSKLYRNINFIEVLDRIQESLKKDYFINFKSIDELIDFLLYNFCLWGFCAFFATLLSASIVSFKIDKKFKMLRFRNEWEYLFRGGVLDFHQNKKIKRILSDPALTYLDVLTEEGGGTKLYTGVLLDYVIKSENHELDRIYLRNTKRYKRPNSETSDVPLVKVIPGDIFVIPASKILNINCIYVYPSEREFSYVNLSLNLLFICFTFYLWFAPDRFDISALFIDYIDLGVFDKIFIQIIILTGFSALIRPISKDRKDNFETFKKNRKISLEMLVGFIIIFILTNIFSIIDHF